MAAVMVTLVDGRTVNRDSDEWRHECLARWVLAKPLPERQEFIAGYEAKHPGEPSERLRNTIRAMHAKAKADRAPGP